MFSSFRINTISAAASVAAETYFILYSTTNMISEFNILIDSAKNIIYDDLYGNGYIMKIAEAGTITWQKSPAPSNGNYFGGGARNIALDASDNVIWTMYNGSTGSNWWVGSLSSSTGASNWLTSRTSGTGNAYLYQNPYVDSSGNIWLPKAYGSAPQMTVMKYNSSGVYQNYYAQNLYGGYAWNLYSSAMDASGNIYMFGCDSGSNFDNTLFKFTNAGTLDWCYEVSQSSNTTKATSMKCDSAGNVILQRNKYIIKIDSTGSLVWAYQLSAAITDLSQGQTLDIDSSDNIYFTFQYGNKNYIIKLDSSGAIQWQRSFNTNSVVTRSSAKLRIKGSNLYLYGTGNVASGTEGMFIMKVPTDGTKTGTYSSMIYQSETTFTMQSASPAVSLLSRSPTTYSYANSSDASGVTYGNPGQPSLSKSNIP